MNLHTIFLSSFLIGLSGALMPGPLTALTMERAASWSRQRGPSHGLWAAVWVSTGHSAAELAMVLALLVGFGAFLSLTPVAGTMGVVGGGVLLWMGRGMMLASRKAGLGSGDVDASPEGGGIMSTLVAGGVVSVSNPYWLLWWATVGASYLALWAGGGTAGVMAFYTGHIASDYAWQLLLAGAVSYGGRWLGPPVYRGLMVGLSLFMGALGLYFIYSGIGFLRPG